MRFKNYIKAGFPILWIKSSEEQRVLLDCVSQLRLQVSETFQRENPQYRFFTWDVVDGIRERKLFTGDLTAEAAIEGTENAPMAPLKWLEDNSEVNSIMFLLDYHAFLDKEFQDSTVLKRKLRNVYDRFKAEGMSLVIIANSDEVPVELEKQITFIDYDLPNKEDLKLLLRDLCVALDREYPDDDSTVISAAQGLTLIEAENAFALSYQETRTFDSDIILREKATIVKKSGALTVVSTRCTVDEIGSMEMLKAWLSTRSECFTEEARQFGIKPPRALLLAGDPGCGKSLAVKSIATIWNRILLRMDIGDLLGGIVGESEAKTKRVLAMADAMSPCVLWVK